MKIYQGVVDILQVFAVQQQLNAGDEDIEPFVGYRHVVSLFLSPDDAFLVRRFTLPQFLLHYILAHVS